MATATPYHDRRLNERRRVSYPSILRAEGMKVSWGGIFGGVLVAVGLLLLLAALGVAVGISATQPGETEASTLGTGAGIWAALSLLVALFVGGLVATRIGAISDGATGFFEGALVWVVSILLMLYFASSGVSMLAGGAFQMVGGAAQALGGAVQAGPGVDVSGNVDQIVARLKDPATAQKIASLTGMQQSEVQAALSETAQRVENARADPAQAAAEARQGLAQLMEKVRPQATRAAWITFGALVLSLLAAVLGAMSGRRRDEEMRAS